MISVSTHQIYVSTHPIWTSTRQIYVSTHQWMWHLGTWFSRRGGVGVTVGLGDLGGLFQPEQFSDL